MAGSVDIAQELIVSECFLLLKHQQSINTDALETLKAAHGNDLSLYIPPTSGQQRRARGVLKKELSVCQSIKDRAVRKLSFHIFIGKFRHNLCCFVSHFLQNALVSAQQKFRSLKQRDFMPHGVALFAGQDTRNSDRMVLEVMAPKQSAIRNFLYFCGRSWTTRPSSAWW